MTKHQLEEEQCLYCGVPMLIHGKTVCGWANANPIIWDWETNIPAVFTERDKRERFVLRNESEEDIKKHINYIKVSTDIYHPFGLTNKEWLEFVIHSTGYTKEQIKEQVENWKILLNNIKTQS